MTKMPLEWLKDFFSRRSLEAADGRALYQYRSRNEEFAELRTLLVGQKLGSLEGMFFVLYAAEWWRRNYSAGHWKWDLIFDSLNIPHPNVTQRNELIKEGLRRWKRDVHIVNDKRRYLATIIVEGGLPIETVAKNNGWLKRLLYDSFRLYIRQKERYQSLASILVEGRAQVISMPQALQKEEVYLLLGDIVEQLARLKEKYQLSDKDSPVAFLDSENPEWRQTFPLPIESAAGRSFIDDLLSEVSKAPPLSKYPFKVKRVLRKTPDGWVLSSEIALPENPPTIDSLGLLEHVTASLPSRMELLLETSSGYKRPFAQVYKTSYKGESALKLSGSQLQILGKEASEGMNLCLYAKGQIIHRLPMTNGEALETSVPWTFVESGEGWEFVGQASQKVSSDIALVVIDDDYLRPEASDNGCFEAFGTVPRIGAAYEVYGTVIFQNNEEKFRVCTAAVAFQGEYVLEGKRIPFPCNRSWVSARMPRLYLRDVETHYSQPARGALEVKTKGKPGEWEPLTGNHHGVLTVRFKEADGYIVFRKQIAILPSDFKLSLLADQSTPTRGYVLLEELAGFSAHIVDQHVASDVTQSENSLKIALRSTEAMPPEHVLLCLSNAPGQDIIFTLPFPANGIRVFDAGGKQLSEESVLFLNRLHGIRIHLFNGQQRRMESYRIRMELCDESLTNIKDIYFEDNSNIDKNYYEIALIDYEHKIRSLLSISNSLDAHIIINISLSGQHEVKLKVYQYSSTIRKSERLGCITLENVKTSQDNLERTIVLSSLLNRPEQTPIPLDALVSQGTPVGSWTFLPQKREDGPWIVYPDKSSPVQFRPLRWSLGESNQNRTVDTLHKAVCISDDTTRMAAIKQLINTMAGDFGHRSWPYLDALWNQMGHLPLPTFDVWRAFIDNPHALVALLCRSDEILLDRMRQEFPIMWELIPLSVWQAVFLSYHRYVVDNFSALARNLVGSRLQFIRDVLRMENLALTLQHSVGIIEQEENIPSNQAVKLILTKEYRGSEDYLGLLSRHGEDRWPVVLRQEIERIFGRLPLELRTLILEEQQDFRRPAVYLPIILAYQSVVQNGEEKPHTPIHIFKMKMLRSFDEEWFYCAFNMVQGYWLYHQEKAEKENRECKKIIIAH